MSLKKPIKVGFDLDGVLLYNPVRIVRPVISTLKDLGLIKRKQMQFFVPKSKFEKLLWRAFHWSSIFVAPGMREIERLKKEGVIEPYLITGRFAYLKDDTKIWFRVFGANKIFKQSFINEKNEQPHKFKERKIKELKLEYFVEDNWDIVSYLNKKFKNKVQISWVYNVFDSSKKYHNKFSALAKFLQQFSNISKKRVLVFTDFYAPHWTGISKSIESAFIDITENFSIKVITLRFEKKLKDKELLNNIFVKRVNPDIPLSRTYISFGFIVDFFKNIFKTDTVFINSPFTFVLPISLLAKIFRKRLVIYHQGDLILPGGYLNKLIQRLFDFSSYISFYLADEVATYTKDYVNSSRILPYFKDKAVSFVISPVFYSKKTTKKLAAIRKIQKNKKPDFIVGVSGRFVEEKGMDILLKAVLEITKTNKNIHFCFAGKKSMSYENFFIKNKDLYKKVKSRFSFMGLLKGERLEKFYNSIDYLVVPSRSECFGLVQPEAMKYKKPVVVSNIPGARDIVRKTGFGLIFKSENERDLAKKILSLQKNNFNKKFPLVTSYFNKDKHKERLLNFISG